ncbi:MCE family protein [Kutzneria buriramensis]|uniref:Phospholipid/cholesterol/gamma-HCH transport system substrate-binding protein n=1 Tax=Kutzneria buriramensis TaxID=1045776 RepID=A0A3E0GUX0_9PSEU|nr:MCE family protein [Kutzneria buriramensis]REH26461.1 phospholipid/cholesterol/gamma-HCH transport system substrate-binding protein [Kutzneria buriramensis]
MRNYLVLATILLATACALPGGADVGNRSYQVTAQFGDVLDLVPQAAVKVDDVPVGRVDTVRLAPDGWSALVTMTVNGDVRLPADAHAYLRQSSLLGEKFVELTANDTTKPPLRNGATIPLSRTNRNPQVEEVLGALSMVLNGGGVAQLQTITQQVNLALNGNEGNVRDLLSKVDALVNHLDAHRDDITKALDGMAKLAKTLDDRKTQITGAIDGLTPGIAVLAEQRGKLTRMVDALDQLAKVAVTTVNQSRDDLVADLKALQPTLQQLAAAGQSLPKALQVLVTFPFTDAVLDDIKGDYLNVYLQDH